MSNPILTRGSGSKKVSSPEQLSDYIKVSNVGVWIIFALIFTLLISVLVWGVTGSLNTTVKATGVAENGTIECYLSSVDKIDVGDEVYINGVEGKVTAISEKPQSSDTVSAQYDEFTAYQLNLSDWNYTVTVEAKDCDDGVVTVSIICDTVKPISFITG